MSYRRTRSSKPLAVQAAELALAVPQVIAHRAARMALAGPRPSARERKEFHRMGAEKVAAFGEAMHAMALQTVQANQHLAASCMQAFWLPWAGSQRSRKSASRRISSAALEIAVKGMAPVHRRAVANARRLRRTKLR
jgi:hypothetical protein